MRRVSVTNQMSGRVLASRAEVAESFLARGVGLLGRKEWSRADGLLIEPCNSVHCFFMSIPIDVIYLDKTGRVLRQVPNLRPWRVGPLVFGAHSVLELPAGSIIDTNCQPGDQLVFESAAG
jgi:uncharacterized protein